MMQYSERCQCEELDINFSTFRILQVIFQKSCYAAFAARYGDRAGTRCWISLTSRTTIRRSPTVSSHCAAEGTSRRACRPAFPSRQSRKAAGLGRSCVPLSETSPSIIRTSAISQYEGLVVPH
jgi:hypothetical protein